MKLVVPFAIGYSFDAELRRQHGNPDLLASTEYAVAVTRQRPALVGSSPQYPVQDYG